MIGDCAVFHLKFSLIWTIIPQTGLSAYLNIISQRIRCEGFIVFDYAKRYREAEEEMAKWIAEGKLKRQETYVHGLEKAPQALNGLFEGANTGKMIVSCQHPEQAKL